MLGRNKKLIWINAILGVAAVFVGAISTFAWFQLDSQAPEATITSKDPHLSIDNENVTGYKVVHTIGTDGFIDRTSTTVTAKKGETFDTSNNHQDTDDINFDIPSEGLGYYLVKKNPSGTFRYNYDGDSYARRFTEYSNGSVYNKYLENDGEDFLNLSVGDMFEIKQYSYDNVNLKTVNTQITGFTSENASTATVDAYYNISVAAAGVYKVWYNSNLNKIVFETAFNPLSVNRTLTNHGPRRSASKITYYAIGTFSSWGTNSTYQFEATEDSNEGKLGGVSLTAGDAFRAAANTSSWTNQKGYSDIYSGCGAYSNFDRAVYGNIQFTISGSNWDSADFSAGTYAGASTYAAASSFPVYIKVTNSNWYSDNAKFGYRSFSGNVYVGTKVSGSYGSNNVTVRCDVPSSEFEYGFQICRMNSSCSEGTKYTNNIWNYSNNVESNGTGTKGRFNYSDNNIYVKTTGKYVIYATSSYAQLSIERAYGLTLDTQGGTINSGYNETYYQYGMTTTLPTDVTKAGSYSFKGWFTSSSGGSQVTSISSSTSGDKTYYAQWNSIYTITLTPSYFVNNGDDTYTKLSINCGQGTQSQEIIQGNTFSTSKTFSNVFYLDTSNSIAYTFKRETGNYWYSDAACSTRYSGTPTGDRTLYAKMICAPLETYYIDISQTNWSGCNVQGWDTAKGLSAVGNAPGTNPSFAAKSVIADKLYRITLPNDLTGFIVHNGYSGGGLNQTNDVSRVSGKNYLLVGGADPTKRYADWMSEKTIAGGKTARIYVKQPGGAFPTQNDAVVMTSGDGTTNNFIYEKGLTIPVGSEVYIKLDGESTYYKYSQYIDGTKPSYIGDSDETYHNVKMQNYTGSMRFNFYITTAGKLSIAMVPLMGNGYYIMPYNSSLESSKPTDTYAGALKMDSNDYSAIYTGYYTAGGSSNRIFIKSYLNAVDTLATSLTSTTSSGLDPIASISDGIITINHSGRYTIQVTNKTVDITPYEVGDFFQLNALDTNQVTGDANAKRTAIYNQKTSLIVEVPFTCTNPYKSNISLLTDCSESYIGVNLYVTSSRLGGGDPATIYSTLRGASSPSAFYAGLTAANTTTPITDKNNCLIVADSVSTYYAYILIDYMPGVTSSDITAAAPTFKLYLQSNQP